MEMHDCFLYVCVCVWHHKAMLVLFRFDNYFLSCAALFSFLLEKQFFQCIKFSYRGWACKNAAVARKVNCQNDLSFCSILLPCYESNLPN